MNNLLFVYGTLIPGQEPAELAAAVRQMKYVGPATLRGRLFDLGEYPGVVLDDNGDVVKGSSLSVPNAAVWRALDEYEGCALPGREVGLFRRVEAVAELEGRSRVGCWVYTCSQGLSSARLVRCGCWLTHLRMSKMSPS